LERQAASVSRRLSLLDLVSRDLLDGAQQLPSPWLVLLPVLVVRLRRSLAFPVPLLGSLVVEDLHRPASLRLLEASLPLVSQAERPASLPDFPRAEHLPDLTRPRGGDEEYDILAFLDDIPTMNLQTTPTTRSSAWFLHRSVLGAHDRCFALCFGVWNSGRRLGVLQN